MALVNADMPMIIEVIEERSKPLLPQIRRMTGDKLNVI
jgi:hypothetical protein